MGIGYEDYLSRGTRRILELFSSADVSAEERTVIASVFADELTSNIGNTEGLRDSDLLIYTASIRYLDSKISQILSTRNAAYGDYQSGIKYCTRQKELFSLFRKNGWSLPEVKNTSPEECVQLLQKRQDSISLWNKILAEDGQIEELLIRAEKELSVSTCDKVIELLNDLEQDITISKQKRLSVPEIKNKDTKKILKRITEVRKNAEQKEAIHKEIQNTDRQIYSIVALPSASLDQWRTLVSLCQKQRELLAECKKRQLPLPAIRYSQPETVAPQYQHYIDMLELDDLITSRRDFLSTKRQYKAIFELCGVQKNNIETCKRNGWRIPNLSNPDPSSLSDTLREEKKKKDKRKRIKLNLCLIGTALIAVALLVLFGIHKYRDGKTQIPFDASYAIGQDQNEVYKELEGAGFKNITRKQDDSGWSKENEVISVTIDNSSSFAKGSYRKPDVNVVITYSSGNRVYVTDILKNWTKAEYTEVEKALKAAGFTNITVKDVSTSDKQMDKLTATYQKQPQSLYRTIHYRLELEMIALSLLDKIMRRSSQA